MRKSMSYGIMPSREEFDAAFEAEVNGNTFAFGNDKRVGTDYLTCNELWKELQSAYAEYEAGTGTEGEEAGDWCSSVLYQLGFEWI